MLEYNIKTLIDWRLASMKPLKKIIEALTVVAIASQFSIGISGTDFRVSSGIIF